MKLNLGCGTDIRKGYLNADYQKFKGVDKVVNLNVLPLPFKDNSAEEIICQDILEHMTDIPKFILELARITKPGAKVFIRVPHFTSRNVWGDLEHKRGFNWDSFEINQYVKDNFTVLKKKITFSNLKFFVRPIANSFPYFYENYMRFFSATNLEIVLQKK